MNLLLKEIRHTPLLWMLVFVPLVLVAERTAPTAHTVLFVLAVLAIVPLAALLSHATESVAEKTGDAIGGLLNATLGNLTELIIAIAALRAGEYMLVKASIAGAIVTNSLFMLGASFLLGGLRYHVQDYNRAGGRLYSALLLMATIALLAPAAVADLDLARGAVMAQKLSAGLAVLLILAYALGLLFSLKTHKELFASEDHGEAGGAGWPIGPSDRHTRCCHGAGRPGERDIRQFGAEGRRDLGDKPCLRRFHHRRACRRCGGNDGCVFCGPQEPPRYERQHCARKRLADCPVCCAGTGASQLRYRSETNGPAVLAGRRHHGDDRHRYILLHHQQRTVSMVYWCLAAIHLRDLRHDALYGATRIARTDLSDTNPLNGRWYRAQSCLRRF